MMSRALSIFLIIVSLLSMLSFIESVYAQTTIYYFDAVSGYYYLVKGNFDVFYVDSSGNRIWIQAYTWDVNNSYIIFQSPVSARIYLLPSSSTKPILNTQNWWLPADPDSSQLTLSITVSFNLLFLPTSKSYDPASYSITKSVTYDGVNVNAYRNITAVYSVSDTFTQSVRKYSTTLDTWISSGVATGTSYSVSASGSTNYFGSIPVSITAVKGRSYLNNGFGSTSLTDAWITKAASTPGSGFCLDANGLAVYGSCYYYVTLSYSGSTITTSSSETYGYFGSQYVSFVDLWVYFDVSVSASATKQDIYQKTFSPDSYGRITTLDNKIVVDVSNSLKTVNLGYTINYLSMALYASTLQITLSNNTQNGFIITLDTSGFANKVSNINPIVYIRDLNKFYPLSIYGFNTPKTIIAVPASLPAGTYTVDIIWNYPFAIGTWSNITSTTYNAPSDILKFLLVNGYVAVNDLYQPYHINVTGIATFSMLAGNLVEINMIYNQAYGDMPIALPYVGNETPISIEMPLPNGSVFKTTLTAYDGAVYAPHLFAWYFDGVDDYINVSSSSSLELSSSFTLAGWFLFPPEVILTGKGIVQKNPQVNDYDYMLYLAGKYPAVFFKNPAGSAFYASYSVDHRDNMWHYWAGTFDGRYLKLYTDGVLRNTTDTGGQTVKTSDTPLTIGYGFGGNVIMFSAYVLIYSRALSDSEIYNAYAYNIINASNLVLFLDPTYYNGTHYIDLSGNNNHGVPYNGVSRVLDNRTWIYTILNSSIGSQGFITFRFFPSGTKISYGSYSIQLSSTLRSISVGNYSFYMPRLGDTLAGNMTIYSITMYNTVYPVDPVNVSISVQKALDINTYPIYIISLAMGIGRGSWAYKIPVYVTLNELPQQAVNVFRLKLPIGIWIKQGLLSPSLEDLAIVDEQNNVLPFMVLYYESSDYAVVFVRYTKPIMSSTLTFYVLLKNQMLWGTGNSFQSLSTFDIINPSQMITFKDPVWNYTLISTYGVYNYFIFTSWDKILVASTTTDGIVIDPSGYLIEYHGQYRNIYNITPIIASRELSLIIKGSKVNIYADGNPVMSIDLSTIFPSSVPSQIYYVGWSGTNVYIASTSNYVYSIGGILGGVQEAPPYQIKQNNNPSTSSAPSLDIWSMMPVLFVLIILAIVMRLIQGGGIRPSSGSPGVRLP